MGCLNYLDRNMLTTIRDSIKEAIPLGDDDFGALFTVFLVVYGVLSPVGGWCADRFSRSRVILISLGVWFAVICLIAFGFARGCSDSNMMPILCQVAEPQHRATGYGILNFFSCCIGGVAAYLGGWMKVRQVDLSYLLMGSAVGVLICALLLILVKPSRRG